MDCLNVMGKKGRKKYYWVTCFQNPKGIAWKDTDANLDGGMPYT